MSSFTGTLQHVDLEGGIWKLLADNGVTFVLDVAQVAAEKLVSGATVKVTGSSPDAMGIGMTGDPVLQVTSLVSE